MNIRQSTPGGDHTLLRGQIAGRGPEPYLNVHAAGFRAVYDFSDPDSSVFIIATGESGHLLSRHYDDLAALWRRSEYIPMSLDPGAGAGAAARSAVMRRDRRPAAAAVRRRSSRGGQRMMRLYLAPARLASAISPRWPKTTSWIGRLICGRG